jgi:hypothetical protein
MLRSKGLTLRDYKIVFFLLKKICVSADTVKKVFKLSDKSFDKALIRLIQVNIIKKMRDRIEVVLVISKRFFRISKCEKCKRCSVIEKDVAGYLHKFLECGNKRCAYRTNMDVHNFHRILYKRYQVVLENRVFNRKFAGKSSAKPIHQWGMNNFISFFLVYYKEKYPEVLQPSVVDIRKDIIHILKVFRLHAGEKWKILCKQYIIKVLDENGNLYDIKGKMWSSILISKFLKISQYVAKLEKCPEENIFCSFFRNDECSIKKNNLECTGSIVRRMKKRYN